VLKNVLRRPMDSDDPPSDDAGMRPPQSGLIRHRRGVRPSPYSPKTPIRQQLPTHEAPTASPLSTYSRFQPFPGLTAAQVKKIGRAVRKNSIKS
jgi:hypothetical protein